ncbi:ABC transporter permease [Mediterraneibacter agrestimuris]|uniref:ABC transporter permease n=1 Tax=Mediterraneibacter agrestimuris TaxID=2941333 RepID=UPI00203E4E76|nr:ABC transporter permease [Mediterraneibacter agrestimuris]
MINLALYKREMKGSVKVLLIFAAIVTLYVTIIISMYDPEMVETLDSFYDIMPEVMAAVGMSAGSTSLIGFMISYLYGFILLVFPMLFCILRGNGLVAKYVDRGSMVTLLAAPVKRRTIAMTQLSVMLSGIVLLVLYITGLEVVAARVSFPGELAVPELLKLNTALLCLHLFIGSICFFASCAFSDTKYSIAVGAGIPALTYVLQMLANTGEKAEKVKYFTFFTLFDAAGVVEGERAAIFGAAVLFMGAVLLFGSAIGVFCKKDMHI